MKKYLTFVFLIIVLLANVVGAVRINLKPINKKEEKPNIPKITGYTQIRLSTGGGRTIEAVEFGEVFLGAEGKLDGGISYKTELNLSSVPTNGAIALGEVYFDIPNLIGNGNIFRFGRFKVPFGDAMPRTALEKPEITDPFYKSACFFSDYDFGVENFSKIKEGSYELAFINGEGSTNDSSKAKDFVGRYIIKQGNNVEFGLSQYLGTYNGKSRNNFGASFRSTQGAFTALFEYANGTDMTATNRTLDSYNVIVQKMSPILESVLIYESWDPNIDAPGDHILSYSFGMNLYRTPQIRLSSMARLQKAETASSYSRSLINMVQVAF